MAPISRVASALSLATFGARSVLADCISYGMDFQNGGSYFQNSLSNDDFTFVSQFEGLIYRTPPGVYTDPFQAAKMTLLTISSSMEMETKHSAPTPT